MRPKTTKKNQHICHLTSVHPPFDIRIYHKECQSLANAGYHVSLIAPVKNSEINNGVHLIPIGIPKSRIVRFFVISFSMWIKALKTHAQVYHFHDPELMFCGILLRLSGKKVIFDVHENVRLSLQSKDWIPKSLLFPVSAFYYITERFCLIFFQRLILAEESYLKYYPTKKSTLILNYPLINYVEILPRTWEPPFRFVYSGVVHPLRGIWEMIELIQLLEMDGINASLDLVGEVRPTGLTLELHEFLTKNHLEQKVFIHGKVDFNQVSGFLKNADIGLALLKPIPNYKESLPTKIFEYMQFGLPVVTNNFPLYKKYVEAPNTGICVNSDNMEQVVEQVVQLLISPQKLRKMSENGIRVIENHYNWMSQEEKLLEVYNKI